MELHFFASTELSVRSYAWHKPREKPRLSGTMKEKLKICLNANAFYGSRRNSELIQSRNSELILRFADI
jgi:hypothetical protein